MAKNIDMLTGSLWDKILIFTLPIAASNILQQLFNSCDLAVVGHYAGSNAVAAVGDNAPVINLIINTFSSLAIGANVVIGNLIGRGKEKDIRDAVHTAITLALIIGVALIFIGILISRPLLILLQTPSSVLDKAVVYLRLYCLCIPFVMLYNFGSAILRSKGDTKRPLYSLMLSGVVNVILNLILVVAFHMDVEGVAIATCISMALSGSAVTYFLMKEKDYLHLDLHKLCINEEYLKQIIKIGVPACLQACVFSISNLTIQSSINRFGDSAMAGSASELNYEMYSFYVISAFNQTTVSFTSQNFGKGDVERCKRIWKLCMTFSLLISGILIANFVIFKDFFIRIYTPQDEVAVTYGVLRMSIVEAFDSLVNTYEIAASTLRAMGHSLLPAVETIFGICVLRIVWCCTVFNHYFDLYYTTNPLKAFGILVSVYPISWVITGTIVVSTYYYIRAKEFKLLEEK